MSNPTRDPYEAAAAIAVIAIFFLVMLSGCAPIPTLQQGPYWFQSGTPSILPEHVVYSYKPPVECGQPLVPVGGLACGAAVRNGQQVFLIWVDSSLSGPDQNCVLNHERMHRLGWHHAQRAPANRAEYCGDDLRVGK